MTGANLAQQLNSPITTQQRMTKATGARPAKKESASISSGDINKFPHMSTCVRSKTPKDSTNTSSVWRKMLTLVLDLLESEGASSSSIFNETTAKHKRQYVQGSYTPNISKCKTATNIAHTICVTEVGKTSGMQPHMMNFQALRGREEGESSRTKCQTSERVSKSIAVYLQVEHFPQPVLRFKSSIQPAVNSIHPGVIILDQSGHVTMVVGQQNPHTVPSLIICIFGSKF